MENIFNQTVKSKKEFILDLIGLSTQKGRIFVFSFCLVFLVLYPTSYLKYLPVRSIWENVFHFVPYSSGMLRSLSMIAHLNFQAAWNLNKISFIVFFLILFLLIKDLKIILKVNRG
ncbi:MAG: DUF2752 domain-containing protein [Patescibacteria group bacterium]|nr:DUF2752 domain-containing protein [Patescibacteria group bacterium]